MADLRTLRIIKNRARGGENETPTTQPHPSQWVSDIEGVPQNETQPTAEEPLNFGNEPFVPGRTPYTTPPFVSQEELQPPQPSDQWDVAENGSRPRIVPFNPNAGTGIEGNRAMIENAITAPYLQKIRELRKKQDILRTMPLTDKDGTTKSAYEVFGNASDPKGEKAYKDFTDQDGRLKSGLKSFLLSLTANPYLRGVRSWGDLANALAYSGTIGVAGAFKTNLNEQMKREAALRKLQQEEEGLYEQAKRDLDVSMQQTRINDVENDNRQKKQDSEMRYKQWQEKQTETKRVNWYKQNKFFDPQNATEAQKRQLAEFGETPDSIGKYDFTNPKIRSVGGISFQYNPNANSWEESDLPKDGSKALVDYEVVDPATGIKHKYTTTSEKAASLKTSLERAGMMVEAAKERLQSQQRFTASRIEAQNRLRVALQEWTNAEQRYRDSKQQADRIAMEELKEKLRIARDEYKATLGQE